MYQRISKKALSLFLTFAMLCSLLVVSASAASGTWTGSGSASDPYQITSQADLEAIAKGLSDTNDYSGKYFKLMNDIVLAYEEDSDWASIGGGVANYSFAGTFDGNGKTISNLQISASDTDNVGLFGSVAANGVVKNLTVSSGSVTGSKSTGAIVGRNYGTVENCSNTGCSVTSYGVSQGVGGVVGSCWDEGTISGCTNSASVTGTTSTTYTGGVVGKAESTVSSCTNTGTVTGVNYTGGVVGYCTEEPVGCENNGTVVCTGTYHGDIVGFLDVVTPVSGNVTITSGGTYEVTENTTFTVSTKEPVYIVGDKTTHQVEINCTVSANVEINDLYATPVSSSANIINFAVGTDNTLSIRGTNLLEGENLNSAVIRVVNTGTTSSTTSSLDITGDGTLYIYKNSMGAGIGGNTNEVNGDITIDMGAGSLFIKGSKTGAVIGNDSAGNATLQNYIGTITIKSGNVNLVNKAQGAGIGGSRMSIAGTCYVTGGNVTLVTDFSAPVIGAGAQKTSTAGANGTLIVTGGSVKTMITSNAYSYWGLGSNPADQLTVPGSTKKYVINNAAIAATKQDASGNTVYLCTVDTSKLSTAATEFTVKNGATTIYQGGLHKYVYADVTTGTINNWVEAPDNNLYLYLPGKDAMLTVNDEVFMVTWNSSTSSFTCDKI